MVKNTLIFIILVLFFYSAFAQTTCGNAPFINPGTHQVSDINSGQIPNPDCAENYGQLRTGGRWFVYTASADGVAKVTSDLASNSNLDTRLHIYSGSCGALTCEDGNDDKDPFGNVRTSEVIWQIASGVTYYIAWDNQYSANGFNFELSETAVSCNDGSLPYSGDFNDLNTFIACYNIEDSDGNGSDWKLQFIDLDGNGSDEDYATTGTNSINAKDDWLFSPPINLTNGYSYSIDFKYNGGNGTYPANENLEVLIVDAPTSSATVLTSLYSETGITRTGNFSQAEELATVQIIDYLSSATGTYYLAFHGTSPENSGSLLLFDFSITEGTLTTSEFIEDLFEYSYNKNHDILTLKHSSLQSGNITVFNLLGQQVLTKNFTAPEEKISLSSINDGVYIIKVEVNGSIKNVKLLKH